ncbi:MAG: HNH endonuclease [Saprospiraceae bacterium]
MVEKSISGLIIFGDRSQLRRAIHLTDPTLEAHHIIPWSKSIHRLIQNIGNYANKGKDFFHMNHPKNGIAVAPWRQSGGHATYNLLELVMVADLKKRSIISMDIIQMYLL